ncbi:hypothetical protein HRI_004947800 [Hibiscus trionum]|uniref:TF-B3 domain-containing protein n=1 Tax=Hibiscus trionum TaxID=183268 RepID=A0A9W7JCC5_HIBTR|nr:hypothetical protein HRI_004947800 [Hibiscus trionum]
MDSSRSGPEMELCSKILKPTDVRVRLSFPTATMREHFKLEGGTRSVDFQARDRYSKVWTFRLYTRKNDGHPKPVLTRGWLDFVKEMGLQVGDKVIFLVHGNLDQLGIKVQRNIKLLGHEYWADV